MKSPFNFEGRIGRGAYAALSVGAFVSQHLIVWACFAIAGEPLKTPPWFWLTPLRTLAFHHLFLPIWLMPAAMVMTVAIDWLLVALAFRRAREANGLVGLAALVVAPVLQIPVILWLCLAPERPAPSAQEHAAVSQSAPTVKIAIQGLLVATALSVAAVFVSAVVLRTYGYALFLASPFVIGLTTGYLGNRRGDTGPNQTWTLVLGGLTLGALALVGLAIEGIICLALASPLILLMGFVGGESGRAIARLRHAGRSTLTSFAVLPILMVAEVLLPPQASFESVESVEVMASPAAVWDSVVHMGPIPDAPAVPFRWGLAYPMRGEILGTGVGAIRRGVFSTGVAYERVTEWVPNQKLSFIVLSDPPTMHELSPYAHVNAPHTEGYFRTLDARFTITPLADGKTRLTLTTQHELDLEPALYWMPIAQWATHANKVRVLAHFRRQAEAQRAPQSR